MAKPMRYPISSGTPFRSRNFVGAEIIKSIGSRNKIKNSFSIRKISGGYRMIPEILKRKSTKLESLANQIVKVRVF
jgi:hypothetical protein